jgi:CheY-like chemotaxis protein
MNMKRVLVFEDELSSQEIARRSLNRIGITDIAFAPDGKTGLAIFDRMEPKPDCILCDIFMPEKDGIEIVSDLAERHFKGGLILITGADAQFIKVAKIIAIEKGLHFLGTLEKPLVEAQLANLLALMGE